MEDQLREFEVNHLSLKEQLEEVKKAHQDLLKVNPEK